MKFKTIFNFIFITFSALILFTSCRDLDQEIQDKRTVVLNMDFQKRSSSRNSPNISSSELNQYNTHLIVAVPSSEQLNSNYLSYYYSAFYADLMSPQDRRVSMEIPMNTDLKVFAFLFRGNYSLNDLYLFREVGAYGQSGSFRINNQTNNISLGISLQSTNNSSTAATNAYSIEEVTPISPTTDSTPEYTFSSTKTGNISYGGSCSSPTEKAIEGNNSITLNSLNSGNYSDCTIKITDSAGNESNTLTITRFTILPNGLIAYYSFDGNANDKIGSFNGNVQGATLTKGRDNRINSAYAFESTSENYIEFGTGMLSGSGDFSILIWINTTQSPNNTVGRILQQRSSGSSGYNGQYMLEVNSQGKIKFNTYSNGYKWNVTSSIALNDGNWHHLTFLQTDNGGKMYLNGNLHKTDNSSGRVTLLTTNKTYVGGDLRDNNRWYSGKIDDIKIYNRALTESEIQTIYNMLD